LTGPFLGRIHLYPSRAGQRESGQPIHCRHRVRSESIDLWR
jgi:hypothetical protein